jgi:hypothetical protein
MNEDYTPTERKDFLLLLRQVRIFSLAEIILGRCTEKAFVRAVEQRDHGEVLRLLACGLDPRRADRQGKTPVEVACFSDFNELSRAINLAIQLWEKGVLTDRGIIIADDETK